MIRLLLNKREKMINNFDNAKDPQSILRNYISNSKRVFGMNHSLQNPKNDRQFQLNPTQELMKYCRIHSSKLVVEETHNFKYVEVEVILPPFKGQGYHIMSVDTQTEGGGQYFVAISIYHDVYSKYDEGYIEPGQRIAVLNPYFRFPNDSACFIKVTKLEDLILLSKGQNIEQLVSLESQKLSAMQLKDLGNQAFSKKQYQGAINIYDRALVKCADQVDKVLISILYGNKALCDIKLRHYQQALKDADVSLEIQPTNQKFLYRKALALLNLNSEEQAFEILKHLDISDEVTEAMNKCKELQLQQSGIYSIYNILKQFKSSEDSYNLEVKQYIGPIEIKRIPNQGRGLFATRDIRPGEMILLNIFGKNCLLCKQ